MDPAPSPQLAHRIIACLLAVAGVANAQPAANPPKVAVGDAWTYSLSTDAGKDVKEVTFTRRVVGIPSDGGMEIQIGERQQKHDSAGNLLDPKGAEYNRTTYKFPMQVGSEWTWTVKFGTQFVMDQRGRHKVVAYEKLTVPAGTFDCYKVEGYSDAAYKASYQYNVKETYWYCPAVNGLGRIQREATTISRDTPSSREKTDQVLVKYAPKS